MSIGYYEQPTGATDPSPIDLSNYVTKAQLTTTSGEIINYSDIKDLLEADLFFLTTVSGDIVAQIGEGGGVTLEQLTTTSGDILVDRTVLAKYTWDSIENSLYQAVYLYSNSYGDPPPDPPYTMADPATSFGIDNNIGQYGTSFMFDIGIVTRIVDAENYIVEVQRTGYVTWSGWSNLWVVDSSSVVLDEVPGSLKVLGVGSGGDRIPFYGKLRQIGLLTTPDTLLLTPSYSIDLSNYGRSVEEHQSPTTFDGYLAGEVVYLDTIFGTWTRATSTDINDDTQIALVVRPTVSGDPNSYLTFARWGKFIAAPTGFPTEFLTLVNGYYGPLYLSETPGLLSQTKPTVGDTRKIAYANNDYIWFWPEEGNYISKEELTTISGNIVAQIDVTSQQLTTVSGDLVTKLRKLPEIIQSASGTLTLDQISGASITNYGQTQENTVVIPAVLPGVAFMATCVTIGMGPWSIKSDVSNSVILDGIMLAGGSKITLTTPALADQVSFLSVTTASGTSWVSNSIKGTWENGGV